MYCKQISNGDTHNQSSHSSISSFMQCWLRLAAILRGMLSTATLSRCYWRRCYRRRYTANIRLTSYKAKAKMLLAATGAMLSRSFTTFRSWYSDMWPPSHQRQRPHVADALRAVEDSACKSCTCSSAPFAFAAGKLLAYLAISLHRVPFNFIS